MSEQTHKHLESALPADLSTAPNGAGATPLLKVLVLGESLPSWAVGLAGPLSLSCATAALRSAEFDAVVCSPDAALPVREGLLQLMNRPGLRQAAFDSALLVVVPALAGGVAPVVHAGGDTAFTSEMEAEAEVALLANGVQAVLFDLAAPAVLRQVRQAVARKHFEKANRLAYATDLATGLPHQAQLLEHMAQLLALRERDPAPMVLIVLRMEGLVSIAHRQGAEAANILRRKFAVRLRGALRASDVVAANGPDSFAVLLGRIEAPGDGERVCAKLSQLLGTPFQVAGQSSAVAIALGVAHYPEHGRQANELLLHATAQASSLATMGREGFANFAERGPALAANDAA